MKQIILCTITLGLSLASHAIDNEGIPFSTLTDDGLKIEYIIKSEADKTCKISSVDESAKGIITIPETVNGYTVTELGHYALNRNPNIISVNLPQSLSVIGDNSFGGCSGITSIIIPEGVTTIGYEAFWGCTFLSAISFPNSLTYVARGSLDGTRWFENNPDGVVYAGKVAYRYKGIMPKNTTVILEEGTLSIAGGAFNGCDELTSIVIPNSVKISGGDAFYGCSQLNKVIVSDIAAWCGINFSDSIASNPLWMAKHLYKDEYTELTTLVIPDGVTKIGAAFVNCSGLTSVILPSSIKSIGRYSFYGCSNLNSVAFPDNLLEIGKRSFDGCI